MSVVSQFLRPFQGAFGISQAYGQTGSSSEAGGFHNGIDYALPSGTPVYASNTGIIAVAGMDPWPNDQTNYNGGFGNTIIDSSSNGLSSLYGHLSQIVVTVGQNVTQGQLIGYSGGGGPSGPGTASGNSTGPHLHFSILSGNPLSANFVDPNAYVGNTAVTPSTTQQSSGSDNPFDWAIHMAQNAASGIGDATKGATDTVSSWGGAITKFTGLPGWVSLVPGFGIIADLFGAGITQGKSAEQALQDALGTALGTIGRYAVIIVLGIVALLLLLEMFKGGENVTVQENR
jgi:murein DD-endopeptidase MepM/ murein hydrolase activator NlpD